MIAISPTLMRPAFMVSLAIILGFFTPRWRIVVMIMIPKAKAAKASRVL